MSLLKLLDTISTENFNEEQTDAFMDRKKMLRKMGNYSKKMALSAIPLGALTLMTSTPAAAQSAGNDIDILNYALTLEFLERNYYQAAVDSGVIPSSDMPVFQQILKHEKEHVAFLQGALGDQAIPEDTYTYDVTAGGTYDPLNDYPTFQILSIGFEDTGVRAYKGQAGFISNKDYLEYALQIHSVEARHASEVRRLATKNGVTNTKGWITGSGDNAPDPIAALYGAGGDYNLAEGNTIQGGADVSSIVSTDAATEAFDEPIGHDFVVNFLLDNHILVPNN